MLFLASMGVIMGALGFLWGNPSRFDSGLAQFFLEVS